MDILEDAEKLNQIATYIAKKKRCYNSRSLEWSIWRIEINKTCRRG